MNITKTKIIADSGCDITSLEGINFACAPLKIITAEKQYVDDTSLDVAEMVNYLLAYNGRSSTSCPNASDWLQSFEDAESIFCITITGTLSGSYNSALAAKDLYEEEHPGRRVHVIDSLSTGPEIALIIEKLRDLILSGLEFDEVCEKINEYKRGTKLLYVLESMKNLANNGRVSPLVAKMVGLLDIRIIGTASDKGDLELLGKHRGERKTLETVVKTMKEMGLRSGRVKITHCLNEKAGSTLRDMLRKEIGDLEIEVYQSGGLCSFYAEKGGLIIGFEAC